MTSRTTPAAPPSPPTSKVTRVLHRTAAGRRRCGTKHRLPHATGRPLSPATRRRAQLRPPAQASSATAQAGKACRASFPPSASTRERRPQAPRRGRPQAATAGTTRHLPTRKVARSRAAATEATSRSGWLLSHWTARVVTTLTPVSSHPAHHRPGRLSSQRNQRPSPPRTSLPWPRPRRPLPLPPGPQASRRHQQPRRPPKAARRRGPLARIPLANGRPPTRPQASPHRRASRLKRKPTSAYRQSAAHRRPRLPRRAAAQHTKRPPPPAPRAPRPPWH